MQTVRRWHVYAIVSPETGRPVYVGRTYGAPGGRFAQHIRAKANKPLADQLRAWILRGLTPTFEVLAKGNGDCRGVERLWVTKLREWGYELFNRTYGGEAGKRLLPDLSELNGIRDALGTRVIIERVTWTGRRAKINY